MIRRYTAYKGDLFLWAERLRDVAALCDKADQGGIKESMQPLYL